MLNQNLVYGVGVDKLHPMHNLDMHEMDTQKQKYQKMVVVLEVGNNPNLHTELQVDVKVVRDSVCNEQTLREVVFLVFNEVQENASMVVIYY